MGKLILGVDAGNHKAKVIGGYGADSFRTNICDWFERDVEETFGPDDMEFEIDNRKGFAGSIALYENEFGTGATYGDTKAHEDTKIRILLAIYRYIDRYKLNVRKVFLVTGQPLVKHKNSEKEKIINMLEGEHKFIVNGEQTNFTIESVRVSPEGSAAFWSKPDHGLIRIIDIGSGTVNMATIQDKHHIHKSSGTMNVGMETLRNQTDYVSISRAIFQQSTKLKWNKNDKILLCGGPTAIMLEPLQQHFANIELLQPKLKRQYDLIQLEPVYANATGFYNLAKGVFK